MTTPKDDASVADGSTDYKALLEIEQAKTAALTTENERVAKDHSAMKGTMRSQTARDAAMDSRFAALDKKISAVGGAQASGDASTLAESLTRITEESQADVDQQQFASEYLEVYNDLTEALGGISFDSTEAADIKAMWNEAHVGTGMSNSQRMRQFVKAARLADKIEQSKTEEAPQGDPPEETDNDDLGTDTGPGSRGASKNLAGLMQKNPLKMTPKELKAYEKDLWAEAGKDMGVVYKRE